MRAITAPLHMGTPSSDDSPALIVVNTLPSTAHVFSIFVLVTECDI